MVRVGHAASKLPALNLIKEIVAAILNASVTVVDEFAGWSVSHQSHLERLYGSRSVKAPSDVIPDYLARVLVGNEKQVSRGTLNGNVGNVSNPDLVWRYGVKLPKQVRLYRIVVSGVGSLNPPCLCPFNF